MSRSSHRLNSRKHTRVARLRVVLDQLEDRCQPSVTGIRPIDEGGNNVDDPTLGTAGTDLLRVSPAAYANGIFTPGMGGGAPTFVAGSRLVSNTLSNQAATLFGPASTDVNTVNSNGLSDFGYTFGQFMDHDMDLTPTLSGQITAASWSAGIATITVADGLFLAGNLVRISGTPGFNTPGVTTVTILTATEPGLGATTFTFALATDPGTPATLGVVNNTTTRDGANGFPIPVDPVHTPDLINLPMSRSVYNLDTGLPAGTPREQINVNTSFLDLSQVYGSTNFIASALRTGTDGMLLSSPGVDTITGNGDDLLPFNNTTYFTTEEIAALGMANDTHVVSNDNLFAAGDVRANETTELSSLHTLFMRNHNRLAGIVADQFASITDPVERDEAIYQEARKLNIAQYQNIVYNGYLPALLGPTALAAYSGYSSTVDPSIANEFSTVAFRFGHSLLNNTVPRDNNDGSASNAGDLTLVESFFNPTFLTPGSTRYTDIGAVLKGDADNNAQEMDEMGVSSIRHLLFGTTGFGEDLIARDMWRAHDNGIGTYNQVRIAYGLPAITDTGGGTFEEYVEGQPFHGFEQISSDPAVVTKLVTAYAGPTRATFLANGKFAGSIDPFAAGIAEDHVPGSNLGILFHTILVDQFERLRDGDRFFYGNYVFTTAESNLIGAGDALGEVIKANTTITNLQADVFRFLAQEDGKGKGYYTTKNGQAELTGSQNGTTLTPALKDSLLAALTNPNDPTHLVLVDATGAFALTSLLDSYASIKGFLQNANGSTANKLSAQLLTTMFNVFLDKVDPSTSIYVPAISGDQTLSPTLQNSLSTNGITNPSGIANIQIIINAAIAELLDPNPDSTFQEALKNCLDGINSNQAIFILN